MFTILSKKQAKYRYFVKKNKKRKVLFCKQISRTALKTPQKQARLSRLFALRKCFHMPKITHFELQDKLNINNIKKKKNKNT